MPQQIEFEGSTHEFPDDFTQQDISKALKLAHSAAPPIQQDDIAARKLRLLTSEPPTKGSPEWVGWRNQRLSDLNDHVADAEPQDVGYIKGLLSGIVPLFTDIQNPRNKTLPSSATWNERLDNNLANNSSKTTAVWDGMKVAAADQWDKAVKAWNSGEHLEAGGHALAAGLPGVGPAAAEAGADIGEGRPGQGFGKATTLLAPFGAAKAIEGVVDGVKYLRTPDNPGNLVNIAVTPHPADAEFLDHIDTTLGNLKRGSEANVAAGSAPASDVVTGRAALKTAMDEHMTVLDKYKEIGRKKGVALSTDVIKQRMKAAISDAARRENPVAAAEADAEIDAKWPNHPYLTTDEVFDASHENNAILSRFHAAPEAAQNSKMMVGGDTATIKAAGDTYREWIKDNLGVEASRLNQEWGQMNGLDHYFRGKTLTAARQVPTTPAEAALQKLNINGEMLRKPGHGIISGLLSKFSGRPEGIDALLNAAFENTEASAAPVHPQMQLAHPITGPNAQLGAGPVVVSPGGGSPPIADTSGIIRDGEGRVPITYPADPRKQLPPATTIFQGDVSPGSGGGVGKGFAEQTGHGTDKVLPTLTDKSGFIKQEVVIDPLIVSRDKAAIKMFRRAYSELGSTQRLLVDKVREGKPLTLKDLGSF